MKIYLTFNDGPSGIFSSQVIDVVKFLNREFEEEVKLVSFISVRKFFENRNKIKIEMPSAMVLPMFPGVHRWKFNSILLQFVCWYLRPKGIIGRSVLATKLALICRGSVTTVVYDGRGAIAAEWHEYSVITNANMLGQIKELEREVVCTSDFRISVSNELVEYWKKTYNYEGSRHVVIPCTLNEIFLKAELDIALAQKLRHELGFSEVDIVMIYSGSLAGWQSFNLVYQFLSHHLNAAEHLKVLFLSERDSNITKLQNEFPDRVICKHVSPKMVPTYLMVGDFGLLIREFSVTNKVASPVKFAEYLACGLTVIISEGIGDFSDFVKTHEIGYLVNDCFVKLPEKKNRKTVREIGLRNFTKAAQYQSYKILTEQLAD